MLPVGWNPETYWDRLDALIHADSKAEILYQDQPQKRGFLSLPARRKHYEHRYILGMPDREAAESLQKKLDAVPSKVWLRQTIAVVRGDLYLTVRPSYKSKRSTAREVAALLDEQIALMEGQEKRSQEPFFSEQLAEAYRNRDVLAAYVLQHGETAAVSVRRQQGSCWRLNWFDPVQQKRQQANVGDIFLVYPMGSYDELGTVCEASKRAVRSDNGKDHVLFRSASMEVIDRIR